MRPGHDLPPAWLYGHDGRVMPRSLASLTYLARMDLPGRDPLMT